MLVLTRYYNKTKPWIKSLSHKCFSYKFSHTFKTAFDLHSNKRLQEINTTPLPGVVFVSNTKPSKAGGICPVK